MEPIEIKGLVNFGNLNDKLQVFEAKAFGAKLPIGIDRKRRLLIEAIANDGSSSIAIGLLASRYRDYFKTKKCWMQIGEAIAHSLRYKSYTSLDSLIKASERASQIPGQLLAALIEQGIDPAENKYSRLIRELRGSNFAGDEKDAHAFAKAAIERFHDLKKQAAEQRKKDRSASAAQIGARIAKQIETNLQDTADSEKKAQAETIVRHIQEAIKAQIPDCIVRVSWAESDSNSQLEKPRSDAALSRGLSARGEVVVLRSPAGISEISEASKETRAAEVDDRSPDSHAPSSDRKQPVQSLESSQLSLFDGPVVRVKRG